MSKTTYIVVFLVMVAAHWVVPMNMIRESESTLAEGNEFWFRTQPIDPTDPFRGKYITLYFEHDLVNLPTTGSFEAGDEIFVTLRQDTNGFAQPDKVFTYQPETGGDQIMTAKIASTYEQDGIRRANLRYSFERFFLEESKASQAERVYWESAGDTTRKTYAVVMIDRDGNPVLKDVRINEQSITDIVRELNGPNQ